MFYAILSIQEGGSGEVERFGRDGGDGVGTSIKALVLHIAFTAQHPPSIHPSCPVLRFSHFH